MSQDKRFEAGNAGPEDLAVTTLRTLAMDAVEKANSGHPGLPMGAADMAHVLWTRHLRFNPDDPHWPNRDRFVLSAGHGCLLQYGLLHLAGYDLSIDDLKQFRQWGSRTPGHPEHGHTPGVETTTGPLGQGFGNGVGMAIAEAMLAARINGPEHCVIEHWTYVLASDGDLMEGVASEAASLAGHLKLNRLIVLYDDNRITIDGKTSLAWSEDVGARFQAYGWHVNHVDGHDRPAVDAALIAARARADSPSLIVARTHIGYGAPHKQDSEEAHGAPLGADEVRATKKAYGWPEDSQFLVPDEVRAFWQTVSDRGRVAHAEWQRLFDAWRKADAAGARLWDSSHAAELPAGWSAGAPEFPTDAKGMATRAASSKMIQWLAAALPQFVGGSADLAPSNKTWIDKADPIAPGLFGGRNFHFGVREHAMGSILNGMSLHGGFRPYGGTFLIFSDYMRPAVRLAALMKQPVIYVWTHDSFYLGEDGPTHQPVEQLMALRTIPKFTLIRPADANETVQAWIAALESHGPVGLVLTRQNLPTQDRAVYGPATGLRRGGYILACELRPDAIELILIATGSEVTLAVEAHRLLEAEGRSVRVVSLPSWEMFEAEDASYRDSVLPPGVTRRLAVEAGCSFGWDKWIGPAGRVIGLDRFGASAPDNDLAEHFGFTVAHVVEVAREMLEG
ncbi:MAG: transketolase [Candidatus Eisenbacteria bacterium]|nr:transketolase [Candidatus Eisenbacteria bacterium]